MLISTFPPLPDESGLGYYRRLSADNVMPSWKELARLCNVSHARTSLLERPKDIAHQLGLDSAWSHHASKQEDLARGWRGLRRTRGDAVCPHCLSESPHLRVGWEHAFMVACPEHKVMLCDRCDACGEKLNPNRERIEQCACGHDLRQLRTLAATDGQLWVAALIASQGSSSRGATPAVEGSTLYAVTELVRTLCQWYVPDAAPSRANASGPGAVSQGVEFLAPMDELLRNWPTQFEAHVRARILSGNPDGRTLRTRLGPWYERLKALRHCQGLQQFLDIILRVAEVEFDGTCIDFAMPEVAAAATHVTATQAAKLIGVHVSTFRKYALTQLRYRTKRFGTRGQHYEFDIAVIEDVIRDRNKWVSTECVQEMLGVPGSVVDRLVGASLLTKDAQWLRNLRKGGPIELSTVHNLVSQVQVHSQKVATPSGKTIALRELISKRTGDKAAAEAAWKAVATGKIQPVASGEKLGDFRYAVADVARYYSRPVLEAGLTVQDLAKQTGWKWESISHWMKEGLLSSNDVIVRGQHCRVVMPAQLLEFQRKYIPLADLAKSIGSKSSILTLRNPDIEVLGSLTLPCGQRRGGLVRIADLTRLAFGTQ